MATVAPTPTSRSAAVDAFERAIEDAISGHSRYPNGTAFIPEHLATPLVLRQHQARPVLIVGRDGSEDLRRPHRRERELVAAAIVGAVLVIALARSAAGRSFVRDLLG